MLRNKAVLITGASRGLGKEILKNLLKQGASCYALSGSDQIFDIKNESFYNKDKCYLSKIDITDKSTVKKFIDQILHSTPIDVLINNAGVYGPIGPIEENNFNQWEHSININLMAPVFIMKEIIPHMKKRKSGKIINLSGGGATQPMPNFSSYAASKAALVRFSETIAKEVESFGIDVNCIAPGALNTKLLDELLNAGADKVGEGFYNKAIKQKESGGSSLTLASELVCFLASSASNGITGRLISAVWDDWKTLSERNLELKDSDIYTLRRITAKDRQKNWDQIN